MLSVFLAASLAADNSAIVVHHTEMKNSSNPIQNFVAKISNFGDAVLEPAVRYRINDAGNLHVLKMDQEKCTTSLGYEENLGATDPPEVECVFNAAAEFDTPGKISYTITSGEGFGHSIWTPENKFVAEFWILGRSEEWIDIEPVPDSKSRHVAVNALISQSAGQTSFVFADTNERVPFTGAVCVEDKCAQTAAVDAGQRQAVDYYIETDNQKFFWPENETHKTFMVREQRQASPQDAPHTLSGGEWAGIGVGIAIGAVAVVYVVYTMIMRRRQTSGTPASPAERQRFL